MNPHSKLFLTCFVFLNFIVFSFSSPMSASETNLDNSPSKETPLNIDAAASQDSTSSKPEPQTSKDFRSLSEYYVIGTYSPLDIIIPNKFGVTVGWTQNADKTWELEYLQASVAAPFIVKDLGKMTDQRISLIGRNYLGSNSFNFNYGLTYFDFQLHLGDRLLNQLTGGNYPSVDLVQVQSLGFNIGIGNRWQLSKNLTIGIDWITWSQPIYSLNNKSAYLDYATNQQDKDDVDTALKLITYFPRLTLLKLQLGYLF